MRTFFALLAFIAGTASLNSQRVHLGIFGGVSAYAGDLSDKILPKKTTNGAGGISVGYELSDHIMLRGGITYAALSGADRYSTDSVAIKRNLSFKTKLLEFSATGEFYLLNLYDRRYSPYIFAGLAIYHYNPYTFDQNNQQVYLKPLSTEGEGIAGYPMSQPYSLTQMAIPFGGGVKFALNENFRIGIEAGIRKLFTDYIDDVSGYYADPADLLQARGQQSVDLSYRGDELADGDPAYPSKSTQRGNSHVKDYYYFGGVVMSYRLGGEKGGGGTGGKSHKSKLGCPANMY
jgi:hypothetical protein